MRLIRRFVAVVAMLGLLGGFMQHIAVSQAAAPPPSQPYNWRNVEIVGGGFVTGVIYNQGTPGRVYARTDIGGAYRLNTATQRWIPLNDWVSWDDWNLLGVESLATDPVEPNRLYMAVGTYTQSWATNGAIIRSTDQGATWLRTDLPFKLGANEEGRSMGERLVIDPHKNNILFFGSRHDGLWKSSDYGATWAKVGTFPITSSPATVGISFIAFDQQSGAPGSPTPTIYAGIADTTTSIYRSTDGGVTWTALPGQPTGYLPHHGVHASDGMLYITYGSTPGPYDIGKGDLWKYNTATGAWTNISPVPSTSGDNYFGYGGLAVDAQHPGTIMVATMNSWWPDDNIYRSTDGGATWTGLWRWDGYPNRPLRYNLDISAAPYLSWGDVPKLGWMIGDLDIDPFHSGSFRYVTGAIIYGADDATALDSGGITHISVRAQGLEETSIQDLVSPPSGAHLLSAIGDLGGFRHDDLTVSPPAGMSSNPIFSSGTSLDYAELAPAIVVRAGYANGTPRAAYSLDGGTTWAPVATEPPTANGAGSIAVSADGATFVWAPVDGGTYYTRDRGATWTASTGIAGNLRIASDRVNANKFYGYDLAGGTLYVSTDGGASFSAGASVPATGEGKLEAVPGREGDLWLATRTGGLHHSTNSGATLTQLADVEEASTISFGKAAPGQSYMALYMAGKLNGVHGLYRSDDAGVSWVRINDDQHRWGWIGQTIAGDPRIYGRVYVGTNGRGIQYGDIGPATCGVAYNVRRQVSGAFAVDVTITNLGSAPITGWTLGWRFSGNQQITQMWRGSYTQSGQEVVVQNVRANALIAPGGTAALAFSGTYSGVNSSPINIALNGLVCR